MARHRIWIKPLEPGLSYFPIDMLRLEELYPATHTDSARIADSLKGNESRVPISLMRNTDNTWYPDSVDWVRRGWILVSHEIACDFDNSGATIKIGEQNG